MGLPKLNGKIDTEMVAETIFIHIANEIHAYNGIETKESHEFCNEMKLYIKEILDKSTNQ